MESHEAYADFGDVVAVSKFSNAPSVLVVCEHASNRIPDGLNTLGLNSEVRKSHVAWDPGALGVAEAVAEALSGLLVSAQISRLVYDCNRPPDAASAIPAQSEIYEIPGNVGLTAKARDERVQTVYTPFTQTLSDVIAQSKATLSCLITVHSFTPVYNGAHRDVEIGILHGQDPSLALAMMDSLNDARFCTKLNEPYSASDGVAHTLDAHGVENGLLNVMIEIRNDLIGSPAEQAEMAAHLVPWLKRSLDLCAKGQVAS